MIVILKNFESLEFTPIKIKNPISDAQSFLRGSILPGLLNTAILILIDKLKILDFLKLVMFLVKINLNSLLKDVHLLDLFLVLIHLKLGHQKK